MNSGASAASDTTAGSGVVVDDDLREDLEEPDGQAGSAREPADLGPIGELWAEYKSTGSPRARDELIVHYAPLVKYVAARVAIGLPNNVDQEDLASSGIVGLMEAVSKFDPDRGFKFESYAAARIRGAIIDDLRSLDWVPRSVRSQARKVEETLSKLQDKLGRTPTDEEVAEEMGVTVRKLRAIYSRVSTILFVSLDRLLSVGDKGDSGMSLVDTLVDTKAEDPLAAVEEREMKEFLKKAIAGLPERERTAITLYYYEGLSLAEISQVVGVSQARISQMNAKSVMTFRSLLNKGSRR
ncbi:MAG TPA: FliA/WhiG family RNA polymerase sigma factor [Actinomycetota bacterium]|nr:FliA/WhiG family RNA polymerase sigma factor [Actinomycetota bacterium]